MITTLTVYLLLFFLAVYIIKRLGGRKLRNGFYKTGQLFLYSIYYNSLAFLISITVFLILYKSSALSGAILREHMWFYGYAKYMFSLFTAWAGLIIFAGIYTPRISNLFLRISLLLGQFAGTVYLVLKYISLEIVCRIMETGGLVAAVVIGIFAIVCSIYNSYFARKAIVRLLRNNIGVSSPHLMGDQFVFVINDEFLEGDLSDIVNLSSGRNARLFPGATNKTISVSIPFDLIDRVRTYSGSFDPYYVSRFDQDGSSETGHVEIPEERDFGESVVSWAARLNQKMFTNSQKNLMVFESCDYRLLNKASSKESYHVDDNLSLAIGSVYLVINYSTKKESVSLFKRLLDLNNLLQGYIIVTDRVVWKEYEYIQKELRNIQIAFLCKASLGTLLEKIVDFEAQLEKNKVGIRTALDWRIEQELMIRKLDDLGEFPENDEEEKTKANELKRAEIDAVYNEYSKRIGSLDSGDIFSLESSRSQLPGSLSHIRLYPARELIRSLSQEQNYSSRVYLIFNTLEVMIKSISLATLSSLQVDHPDRINFPWSITGVQDKRGDIIDYADDVRYLSRHLAAWENSDLTTDSMEYHIASCLTGKVDLKFSSHFDSLAVFFPFIQPQKIETIMQLLAFTSYLRNQIRGHGAVSSLMASVSYGILMDYLGAICTSFEKLGMSLSVNEDHDVLIRIMGHSLNLGKYIMYSVEKNDFFYLEGIRKGKSLYIGYVSGVRYRPSVLLESDTAGA